MDKKSFEEILSERRLQEIFRNTNEKVKELHGNEFIGFYARNLTNKNQSELFYFLENGIVKVEFKFENDHYLYPVDITHYGSKLKTKKLSLGKYQRENTILSIELEDGTSFTFESENDSDDNWNAEYTGNIIDIYKAI